MISAGVSISESGAPIWVGGRDIENQLIVFGLAPRICGSLSMATTAVAPVLAASTLGCKGRRAT
jgi:hypothetical protein